MTGIDPCHPPHPYMYYGQVHAIPGRTQLVEGHRTSDTAHSDRTAVFACFATMFVTCLHWVRLIGAWVGMHANSSLVTRVSGGYLILGSASRRPPGSEGRKERIT